MLPPKMGIVNGRIQRIPRASDMHDRTCKAEGYRLADTDFDRRFGELVSAARAANVVVLPGGDAEPAGAADARSARRGSAMSGRGFRVRRRRRWPTGCRPRSWSSRAARTAT